MQRKAVQGRYEVSTTYSTWTDEDREIGDTDRKGMFNEPIVESSLEEIPGDLPDRFVPYTWNAEYQGSQDVLLYGSTEGNDTDFYEKGETTYLDVFVKRLDDAPLSIEEIEELAALLGRQAGGQLPHPEARQTEMFSASTTKGKKMHTVKQASNVADDLFQELVSQCHLDQAKVRHLYDLAVAANSHEEVDAVLVEANRLLDGHGVEGLPEDAWVDRYYQNIIALYVNLGDPYKATLLYDTELGVFMVAGWGDFLETWEQEQNGTAERGASVNSKERPMRNQQRRMEIQHARRVRIASPQKNDRSLLLPFVDEIVSDLDLDIYKYGRRPAEILDVLQKVFKSGYAAGYVAAKTPTSYASSRLAAKDLSEEELAALSSAFNVLNQNQFGDLAKQLNQAIKQIEGKGKATASARQAAMRRKVLRGRKTAPLPARLAMLRRRLSSRKATLRQAEGEYEAVIENVAQGPGKFEGEGAVGEWVYEQSLDGWGEELGDSETFGHYNLLSWTLPVLVREPNGDEWTFRAVILHEGSQGFVDPTYYETKEAAAEAWADLEEEYSEAMGPEEGEGEGEEAPSQEEINENIAVGQKGDQWLAYYNRKPLITAESDTDLFAQLRAWAEKEGFYPSIYQVNDHGNVTAYDYEGNVVGEWV
jgi:hypothetical protein